MYTFNDLRKWLVDTRSLGVIGKMTKLMPGGLGEFRKMMQEGNYENEISQLIGIIDSMTPNERRNPKIITPSRLNRIARGAGVELPVVKELVKSFVLMVRMKGLKEVKQPKLFYLRTPSSN
jgi:signal recognition particle subunit SRP54